MCVFVMYLNVCVWCLCSLSFCILVLMSVCGVCECDCFCEECVCFFRCVCVFGIYLRDFVL